MRIISVRLPTRLLIALIYLMLVRILNFFDYRAQALASGVLPKSHYQCLRKCALFVALFSFETP